MPAPPYKFLDPSEAFKAARPAKYPSVEAMWIDSFATWLRKVGFTMNVLVDALYNRLPSNLPANRTSIQKAISNLYSYFVDGFTTSMSRADAAKRIPDMSKFLSQLQNLVGIVRNDPGCGILNTSFYDLGTTAGTGNTLSQDLNDISKVKVPNSSAIIKMKDIKA